MCVIYLIDKKAKKQDSKGTMLPDVQDLFVESWQIFKKSIFNIFLFYLIGVAIFIALIIIGAILLGITGVGAAALAGALQGSPSAFFQSPALIFVVILAAVYILALLAVGFILQIGPILIVNNPEKTVDFKAILQKSLHLAWPLFLTQLLAGLIVFGGIILLIIPGIVISILLSFSVYEVILENKRCLDALRRSAVIISKNFWGILLRVFILVAISMLAALVFKGLPGLYFVFNLLWGWFGIVYSLTLYKQAKKGIPETEKGSLKLPVIISIIGWIIFVVAFSLITQQASQISKILQENGLNPSPTPRTVIQESTPSSQPLPI